MTDQPVHYAQRWVDQTGLTIHPDNFSMLVALFRESMSATLTANAMSQAVQAAPALLPMEEMPEGRFVAVRADGAIDIVQRSEQFAGKFQRDTGFVLEPSELKGWFDHRSLKAAAAPVKDVPGDAQESSDA